VDTQVITIYEDYPNQLSHYREYLSALNKLKSIVGKRFFSLQADGTLQIMHYIGFFQFGNTRIQILPKVYAKASSRSLSSIERSDSLKFVYQLLYASGYLNIKKLRPQLQSASGGDLLEIFIDIFITEFIKEFRKTIYRDYVQREDNQQFVKGKIIVSETIRRNPVLKHLHYTRFDEYSINNPLNQVFKALIWLLLRKTKNINNKKKLVIGLTYLQDVELVSIGEHHFKSVKFSRLNNSFEALFNLAKLFFYNQQPGLKDGHSDTFSFLVPMHRLFESYIEKILAGFNQSGLTFRYHSPRYYLGKEKERSVFLLEPDFTVFLGQECKGILDAKYKYPFNSNERVKISPSDVYQLSAYSLRYNCRLLVLIYPKFLESPKEEGVLAEYDLQSSLGSTKLIVVQVDIIQKDMDSASYALYQILAPFLI
jgi:5-methylcytosine-specific restriction enzyme subunit McrC